MMPGDDSRSAVIELVRRAVESVCWSVAYHEIELRRAHGNMAAIRSMVERGQYSKAEIDIDELGENLDDFADDGPPLVTHGVEFVRYIVQEKLHGIHWHETELHKAYGRVLPAKLLLERLDYPELNFDEIMASQVSRANEIDA